MPPAARPATAGAVAALTLLAGLGCTPERGQPTAEPRPSPAATPSAAPSAVGSPSPDAAGSAGPRPGPRLRPVRLVRPGDLRPGRAVAAVRRLAGVIGPREATGPAYRRAAEWVSRQLHRSGWQVRRQRLRVPAGVSWGVPVPAGSTVNLVATRPGFDPARPHLVLGAHLDTVPQAPGAEDNASGVGVLLAVAAAAAGRRTRLPVRLAVFGAEEPRGPTDDDHHYGSRVFVAGLRPAERRALRGMVSLDRVGVGEVVPVCAAEPGPDPALAEVLAAARRAAVPTTRCVSRTSDHWSFVRNGLPGVRVGGTSYAGYHSPGDVPAVVSRAQLGRAGRVVLSWLRG